MKQITDKNNYRVLHIEYMPVCLFCKNKLQPNSAFYTNIYHGYEMELLMCRDCLKNPKIHKSHFQRNEYAELILLNEIRIEVQQHDEFNGTSKSSI